MDNAKEIKVYDIFERIAASYDRANTRISLGLHKQWKKMLTRRLVQNTPLRTQLLDVCCGTGDIAVRVAEQRPDLYVTGLDFSPAMLAEAKRRAAVNVRFLQGNAMSLPAADNIYTAACISFGLRNTADYEQTLREMLRVVKPDGYIYCLDSFVPDNPLIRPFYRIYFRFLMPLFGGGFSGARDYRWLYESTEHFLRKHELVQLFRDIGITEIKTESRMFGACVLVWGRKTSVQH